jgi:hypothetical protein
MPRTFAAGSLIVLALILLGKALAGPPDGVAGKMVLDEVADGLRKYRKETDQPKRLKWLAQLAATHDMRVQVALVDAHRDPSTDTGTR